MEIRAYDNEDDNVEMTKNIPLFRKAVEWVEWQAELEYEDEREWIQRSWFTTKLDEQGKECGTAYCVAGYVCVVAGWKPFDGETVVAKNGEFRNVMDLACELLGIDQNTESTSLFAGDNNAAQVRYFAEQLCGERL